MSCLRIRSNVDSVNYDFTVQFDNETVFAVNGLLINKVCSVGLYFDYDIGRFYIE